MRGGPDERDDAVVTAPAWRAAGLVAGAVLAVTATAVVFLTDDPRVLRLAVVGAAWSFVLALLVAGRHRTGAVGSTDPSRAAELGLAREAADRRERELDAENRLRRESDEGLRAELAALRRDVAALGALRQDVAALGALRQDVAALAGMRADVAALGALREDVVGPGGLRDAVARVSAMRTDLEQLAELRADVGRLRAELTEQLSSEMLLERVVMRTQTSRGPVGTVDTGPGTRSIEAVSWSDEPPRELTGGWPAVRLDTPAAEPAASVTRGYDALQGIRPRQAAAVPAAPSAVPGTDPAIPVVAETPLRRRRTDPATAEQLTVERPRSAAGEFSAPVDPVPDIDAWPRPPAPLPPDPPAPASPPPLTVQAPGVPTPGEARLAQILAESGAAERPGGRRRHRYRDEDEDEDGDVLNRVLGRH